MAAKAAKWIRNLQPVRVVVRLNSRNDPFNFTLEPRGFRGDVISIPPTLNEHPSHVRNLQMKVYEQITKAEADAIEYEVYEIPEAERTGPVFTGLVRPKDVNVSTMRVKADGSLVAPAASEDVTPTRFNTPGTTDFGSTEEYLQTGVVRRKRGSE